MTFSLTEISDFLVGNWNCQFDEESRRRGAHAALPPPHKRQQLMTASVKECILAHAHAVGKLNEICYAMRLLHLDVCSRAML